MGKSTISLAIFNSYVSLPEGIATITMVHAYTSTSTWNCTTEKRSILRRSQRKTMETQHISARAKIGDWNGFHKQTWGRKSWIRKLDVIKKDDDSIDRFQQVTLCQANSAGFFWRISTGVEMKNMGFLVKRYDPVSGDTQRFYPLVN